ncbi:MAG TPA: PAS domain S-box protein [Acidobacteriota bacterium]|nr:PAS domain S-box protein [Acidobacteriota bacterium]
MIRLLLVEDSREYREFARFQLTRLADELEFIESESAREALVKIAENKIDCILCDYRLPDSDGLELLKEIRQRCIRTPFIFLTGKGSERVAGEAFRVGADDYWVKESGGESFVRLVYSIRRLVREREGSRNREEAERVLRDSHERYRAVLETAEDPIFIKDLDLRYLQVNPAMSKLLGFREFELVGKTDEELFGAEAGARIRDIDARVLQGEVIEDEHAKPVRGILRTFHIIKAPLRDMSGKITGLFGIARELTQRRHVEDALGKSERRYRELVELARDIILTINPYGKFASINSAFESILGWPAKEWIGKGFAPLIHPGDLPVADKCFESCLLGEKLPPIDLRVYSKSGDYRFLEVVCTPMFDGEVVLGVHCLGRDITERKESENALTESEKSYRTLFEKNIAGVYRTTAEGIVLECNNAFAWILGYNSREEILRQSTPEFYFCASEREEFIGALEGRGEITNEEYRLRRKDGREIWVLENAMLLPGGILQGTLIDITQRKEAEEALRASEERHKALLETLPDLIFRLSRDGEFLEYHAGKVSQLMMSPAEFLGRSVRDMLAPELAEKTMRNLEAAMETGETQTFEYETQIEGDYHGFEARIVRCGDNEAMVIIRDITEHKQAEEDLKHSYEKLESQARLLDATNKELETFAYTVSHDLQAPLRRISNWINLLITEHGDTLSIESTDFLSKIDQNSKEMSLLVEALLNLSQVSRAEIRRVRVDLSAMVKSIAEDLRNDHPNSKVDFSAEEGLSCEGDPRLLHVMLKNILSNAWKYTSKEEKPRVEFGAIDTEIGRSYFVRDNGVGFDPSLAGKLFVPFQRLHDTRDFQGSGIGLATAQRIIHRHGGRIWAESRPGAGASFFFTLGRSSRSGIKPYRASSIPSPKQRLDTQPPQSSQSWARSEG